MKLQGHQKPMKSCRHLFKKASQDNRNATQRASKINEFLQDLKQAYLKTDVSSRNRAGFCTESKGQKLQGDFWPWSPGLRD